MSFSNSTECYVCVALHLEGLNYKENLLSKFVQDLLGGKSWQVTQEPHTAAPLK